MEIEISFYNLTYFMFFFSGTYFCLDIEDFLTLVLKLVSALFFLLNYLYLKMLKKDDFINDFYQHQLKKHILFLRFPVKITTTVYTLQKLCYLEPNQHTSC